MDIFRDNDPDLILGREASSRYFEIVNATNIPTEVIAAAQGIKDDDLSEDTDPRSTIKRVERHWIKRADRLFGIKFSNPDDARYAVLYSAAVASVLQERQIFKNYSETEDELRDKLVPLFEYRLSVEQILERPEYQEIKKIRDEMGKVLFTSSFNSIRNIGTAFRVAKQIGDNKSREIENQIEKVFEDPKAATRIKLLAQHSKI